jgi:hypothetical protein
METGRNHVVVDDYAGVPFSSLSLEQMEKTLSATLISHSTDDSVRENVIKDHKGDTKDSNALRLTDLCEFMKIVFPKAGLPTNPLLDSTSSDCLKFKTASGGSLGGEVNFM